MTLKEFFLKLGLDLDAQSFAKGQLAVDALRKGLDVLRAAATSVFSGLGDAFIGFNARAEDAKLRLTGLAEVNLKVPFEEAAKAADELYAGLQADAAKTPSETAELVDFATDVANAYLSAGKSMKELRDFTTQAVVGAKMIGASGTAAFDIVQALGKSGVQGRDRFTNFLVKGVLGMTPEQFNAKSVKDRADLLTKALGDRTFADAMKAYEKSWAGVTSTLKDNLGIIGGAVGKPLFNFLKESLGGIGDWIQKNRPAIIKVGLAIAEVFKAVFRVVKLLFLTLYKLGEGVVKIVVAIAKAIYNMGPLAGTITALTGAVLLFGKAWLLVSGQIILLASLFAIAFLIFDDLMVGINGGKSVIFELFDAWEKFLEAWAAPHEGDGWLLRQLRAALDLLLHFERRWDAFKEAFTTGHGFTGEDTTLDVYGTDDKMHSRDAVARQAAEDAKTGQRTFNRHGDFIPLGKPTAPTYVPTAKPNVSNTVHVDKLQVTTTGDPHDVASKVRTVIQDVLDLRFREAYEGVK